MRVNLPVEVAHVPACAADRRHVRAVPWATVPHPSVGGVHHPDSRPSTTVAMLAFNRPASMPPISGAACSHGSHPFARRSVACSRHQRDSASKALSDSARRCSGPPAVRQPFVCRSRQPLRDPRHPTPTPRSVPAAPATSADPAHPAAPRCTRCLTKQISNTMIG